MPDAPLLGAKLRALRRRENLTQVELAERLAISPSYLNLIENNRRPLTAPLLIRLAQCFQLDLQSFGAADDSRLTADLLEAFGDPMFESHGLTNADVRELAVTSPNVARAVISLYRSYTDAKESVAALGERLSMGEELAGLDPSRLPSEEVSDLVQRRDNHFPDLEEAAERLWQRAELTSDDVYRGLVRYLAAHHRIEVKVARVADERKAMRRFDPTTGTLSVSEVLPPRSRRFQLAHQVGLCTEGELLDRLVRDESLSTPESRALGKVALANYFAAAVLMPYQPFLEAARAERYDIELLAHRFGASFEQVCHRLTTLRRPGAEGVPLHFLRIDIAGNISKRFSGSGIRFARFGGACPRWNVHAAFMTPGMIRIQVSRMPDGNVYFCIARTVRSDRGGYLAPHNVQAIGLGCDVRYARALVYADGIDVDNPNTAVPVGVTCRICEHLDCEQRAFPALTHPLRIDENVRGVSFYAPVEPETEAESGPSRSRPQIARGPGSPHSEPRRGSP
jgi:predicted transcriptional regulator/transcriptional regulator with XRE-family HTH domain